ncbi:MAG: amino acid permease [Gammaproteobacteria bacterium]|nr:amino acid permease [Gammaproteobacteria bacterium]NNF60811.1 amino acid permease [Gammaproteobacteria bacterium]NNM21724.1 amino acid permease [Gammaproteobacteria bacterium]
MTRFRYTAIIAVVVANMVGTGVFTSLGFQLLEISSGFVLMMLWAVGGVIALCGAMSYAELGAALPRSGGEYNFLSRIYHPAAGFVSGWVSATIGFAAPTALAAITFSAYATSVFPAARHDWLQKVLASLLVVVLALGHAGTRRNSSSLQMIFTILKVMAICVFCIAALLVVESPQPVEFLPQPGDASLLGSASFAVALIYVSYAYTGWNAATYLSGELDRPQRYLPLILLSGTLLVMLLYLALNYVFLRVGPMDQMRGQVEIGFIAAEAAFGPTGGKLAGVVLAALLISTVSAMTLAGPRVLQVIGEDFSALRFLARTNSDGVPTLAIMLQSLLAVVFIITSGFESILVFAGFTLALNSFVTVFGVFVLRWRQPGLRRPYRVFAYPLPPLVYLMLTGWTLVFVLIEKPVEGLFGLGIIAVGLIFHFFTRRAAATGTT